MSATENKALYTKFCENHKTLPLFYQPQWLDVVCGGGQFWDVVLSLDKESKIQAIFPFHIKNKYGIKSIINAKLTPCLGLWIEPNNQISKVESTISRNKSITEDIISKLPVHNYFNMLFHPSIVDWQVFKWHGYRQQTRYTYRLDTSIDAELLRENLSTDTRNAIRKGSEELTIKMTNDVNILKELNKQTFERQGLKPPFESVFLQNIYDLLIKTDQVKIYTALDNNLKTQGAIMVVNDQTCAYGMVTGTANNAHRSTTKLLLWQAILDAKKANLIFDFEGSDLQKIEPIFRTFGGQLTPYYQVYGSKNKFLHSILTYFNKFG